jgi:hypothetical protein
MDEATRQAVEAERNARRAEISRRDSPKRPPKRALWDAAAPCATHAYLMRKGVKPHGLRLSDWPKWIETEHGWRRLVIADALLIPMLDENGALWNLQAIFPEAIPELGRDKDFMSGRKAGLHFPIGEPTETLLVAEGYATAATLHTHRATLGHFDAVHIGLTATPNPGELRWVNEHERQLARNAYMFFDGWDSAAKRGKPTFAYAIQEGIAEGYLVPYRIHAAQTQLTVEGTTWNDEDIAASDWGRRAESVDRLKLILDEFYSTPRAIASPKPVCAKPMNSRPAHCPTSSAPLSSRKGRSTVMVR